MKKIFLALAVVLLGTVVMNAQPPRRQMDKGQMLEKRVERLERELSLTPEQKAEIMRIYTEEMEARHQAGPSAERRFEPMDSVERQARRVQMEQHRQAINARIVALLTPEQAEKFARMNDRDMRRGHGHGKEMRHSGRRGDKGPRPDKPKCHQPCDCADK